ncbi:MAG TPA: hypothetical protein VFY40_25120 [Blastocatellia bacterium]|nr:hypothetical protein [Blastocatellia bacterium]
MELPTAMAPPSPTPAVAVKITTALEALMALQLEALPPLVLA